MAELVLSTLGGAVGARVAPLALRAIGGALGRVGGALLGRAIDDRLFGETRHREGARLTDLHLQGSTEGASIPAVYGCVRISGQVIWAARFKERAETTEASGKGGPRATRTDYSYSLSFAVGLCEGEVSRIGRVWANGEPFDMSRVTWRLHRGGETQEPDTLIEAVEGADAAPAYRGLAYVVFEDLPLDAFGNTIPQLSFEIVRPAPGAGDRLEDFVRGVCLIPGSGEFVYATDVVRQEIGPGQESAENVHAERDRANLRVSLDQLAADLPNCGSVLLVVSWFGDDLRCGECQIRPGVEIAEKDTAPLSWRAGGVDREGAYIVSQLGGAPAYGGTPSDASVVQAIAELKARGYKVGIYPFILMDVPADNALTDPYGGAAQAAYPWRGRISVHPAAGETGTADKTAAAATQIGTFFGDATPGDFSVGGADVVYDGPSEWSFRRFVLHLAKLAELAGGVDTFVIGSELRALTTARSDATTFPAVAHLQTLAGDVRAMLGAETTITYAADWSEYYGYQPQDGSSDVFFHLDPLWADENIDVVGVDWYAPLTDWRGGASHLDAEFARSPYDPSYLESRIEAGEAYDFFYEDHAARAAQTRSPIVDGAHDEPWIYRAKDLRNFWARTHYDRPGGVRAGAPTEWVAQSKPIWLIELGCPAVDKGANAPNLFIDDKSSESALPPFSSGARDDLIQRGTLEAYLKYWSIEGDNNSVSTLTGAPMVESAFVWCWDARPYPAFPARDDVWSDGGAWRLGHWLNGRAGLSDLAAVVAHLCARAGAEDVDVSALTGAVGGYVVDAPVSARAALEPLMAAYDFVAVEREGRITFEHRADAAPIELSLGDLSAESAGAPFATRSDAAEVPIEARVRFIDPERDHLIGAVSARRLDRAEGGVESFDAPLALDVVAAEALAQRLLYDRRDQAEALALDVGPAQLGLEPADLVSFEGGEAFEVRRIEDGETRRLHLTRAPTRAAAIVSTPGGASPPAPHAPTPVVSVLDLPPLPGREGDDRPLVAVFASPWTGAHEIHAGADEASLTRRANVSQRAIMGELLWDLSAGPVDRWDEGNTFRIKLYDGALASVSDDALFAGANVFAIESEGEWEIIQARDAVLVGAREYELSGLLRGQLGSAHAMRAPHPAGARIVKLDARLARLDIAEHEWGDDLVFASPPAGVAVSDDRAAQFELSLASVARRPWAPTHLQARRGTGGDVRITWIRVARVGGDYWGAGDPPAETPEAYRLEILDGSTVKRSVDVSGAAEWTYSAGQQATDFGAPPISLRLRVAQISASGVTGLNTELTIPL